MSFDGHGSTQTKSISLYIQQESYRGPKNMDPLIKIAEKGYKLYYKKVINAIKPKLKLGILRVFHCYLFAA